MLDIRPKNLARDLIKPLKEKGLRTRNLDYLKLVFKPKNNCLLFATFPASGANWTDDITGYVLAKTFKGISGIEFDEGATTLKKAISFSHAFISPADARTIDTDPISKTFPELGVDHMFHTHGIWRESGLWWLDSAKTAMITRHIPTSIFSYASKRRDVYQSFEECLEKTGILDRVIRFYNSWYKYKIKNPNRFYAFKYEDCRSDPKKEFSDYLEYMFNKKFDPKIVEEAIDFFSFDKQKERESKFNKDENKHFHYKGKTSYKDETKPETYQHILQRLSDELTFDFGYDYKSELQENQRLAS